MLREPLEAWRALGPTGRRSGGAADVVVESMQIELQIGAGLLMMLVADAAVDRVVQSERPRAPKGDVERRAPWDAVAAFLLSAAIAALLLSVGPCAVVIPFVLIAGLALHAARQSYLVRTSVYLGLTALAFCALLTLVPHGANPEAERPGAHALFSVGLLASFVSLIGSYSVLWRVTSRSERGVTVTARVAGALLCAAVAAGLTTLYTSGASSHRVFDVPVAGRATPLSRTGTGPTTHLPTAGLKR
jgi:hypothetical protein